MMGRAIGWGLAGLFISVAMHCALPATIAVTTVTSVVGAFDWHLGEIAVGILAAGAAGWYVMHPHQSPVPLILFLAVIPAGCTVLGAAWYISRPGRRYERYYARQGARLRAERHGYPAPVPLRAPAGEDLAPVIPLRPAPARARALKREDTGRSG